MKSLADRIAAGTLVAVVAAPAHAALNVFATVPEWGALAEELGGDKVKVYTATNALQDPHHVEAKPEPDRARAQRRPRRRHRRRARDRLAAAGAAAGRQSEGPAGQARLLRGRAAS